MVNISLDSFPNYWRNCFSREWISTGIQGLLRSYAEILFISDARVGTAFLLATMWLPNIGSSGLLAAIIGMITARVTHLAHTNSGLYTYNSLLVGLTLGSTYTLDGYLFILIFFSAILTVFVTVSVADVLWRFDRLPALSLPFVLVAYTVIFAARQFDSLRHYLTPLPAHAPLFFEQADHFLTSLGYTFFIPHPIPALLIFLSVLLVSHYLVLLAVSGFFVGHILYHSLSALPYLSVTEWAGFNFTLTAMALGGVFMVPGRASFCIAMIGAAIAAIIATSAQSFLLAYELPVLTIPYLLSTLTILAALSKRVSSAPPHLLLDKPALPEVSLERARMIRARGGHSSSVPVNAPFLGEWVVYQGFNGRHTHRPPWQHAFDFIIMVDGQSFQDTGLYPENYYCFGVPVVSPVYGTVVRCINNQPDNRPGEVNNLQKWGNLVLIRLYNQLHVLICHLQQYSLEVIEGQVIEPGQSIGRCGNSGRSPQPHIHLHVQKDASLDSPTVPFHFTQIITVGDYVKQFKFYFRPAENQVVRSHTINLILKSALHFPVGRKLYYRFRTNDGEWKSRIITVVLTLEGQFLLKSSSGGEIAFTESKQMLSLYDRKGCQDLFLDLFVLCLGVTPFGEEPLAWSDQPSWQLFPLSLLKRCIGKLLYWSGKGVVSSYERHWNQDQFAWNQIAKHQLNGIFIGRNTTSTLVAITPEKGCTRLSLKGEKISLEAELCGTGLENDIGIPQHITNIHTV